MITDPDIRKGLLVSLVTSVLVLIFIDPLLKLTASWLMSLGSTMATSWTNGIYLSAALGLREKFSFIILALGASIISGVTAGVVAGRILARRSSASGLRKRKGLLVAIDAIFALLFLVGSFGILTSNFAELQLVASFNQRLTVLAAKATDQQVRDLRASWAMMQNRKDYEAINAEMQKLSAQFGVKLPTPLWE